MKRLEHTYQRVFGFFDFEDVYRALVATAPFGATLVELGVYMGRSAAFLAVEAHNADRALNTVHIDNFVVMHPSFPCWHEGKAQSSDGTLYEEAERALLATGATCWRLLRADQHEAHAGFAPGSCWAVWLDTDHEYGSTRQALAEWWPKVQAGGWFGGHDYGHPRWPGVQRAVDEWAREIGVQVLVVGGSWVVRKGPAPAK